MKGLESLTEFVEKCDERILRGYSIITKRWEDKGRSKYSLSGVFDFVSYMGYVFSPAFYSNILELFVLPMASSTSLSLTGLMGLGHSGIKEENGNYIVKNSLCYFFNSIGKTIRTPELIAGIGFAGKGIYDLYNYFENNDSSSLSEGVEDLSLGISLVSNASAWFIRDSDPKLLNQKPFWRTAYEKIGGEPQTELKPIPIKVNFSKPL